MTESAYKQAGVDIHKAADLVQAIKPHIKKTHRSGVMSGIGGFGALFDLKETGYKDPVLVSGTDGVGTKIKIAIELDRHDTIGIDAVAMCVNDIVVQGAEPLFFLDYFATGQLHNEVAEAVIKGIAEGCEDAGCALIGGETAEMPGLYAPGDYDIAGFSVGAVEREDMITGEAIKEGDVILGLASNGVHSNGFSLVRKLIKDTESFTFESKAPFDDAMSLGDLLLMPTRIYVKSILEALKIKSEDGTSAIHGMAHITGGGLWENIPRVLPEELAARIDCNTWRFPPMFKWFKEIGGLTNEDLSMTLNCGLGMVVVCDPAKAQEIEERFGAKGETVFRIGDVVKRITPEGGLVLQNADEAWA